MTVALAAEGDDKSVPASLRTYLSAAFYEKRFDGGRAFRIAIKGSPVAPFSKTRDLHPADCWRNKQWTLQGNNDRSLTIKFSVGWSAEEDAGSADNCAGDNARPFGFCVCNAGMMYSTFDNFKRMRKGQGPQAERSRPHEDESARAHRPGRDRAAGRLHAARRRPELSFSCSSQRYRHGQGKTSTRHRREELPPALRLHTSDRGKNT